MIVKVQQSITTNEENPQMLIYNKSRSIMYQDDLTLDVKELLGDRLKVYFKAKLIGPRNDKKIQLIEEVKPKNW